MRIEINKISKTIKHHRVLNEITLSMESGKVYGFTGPNGCGKTMLFRALSGLIRVDEGEILVDGKRLKKDFAVLPSVGIILENVGLYPDMDGSANLELLAGIKGIADSRMIEEAIRKVGLDPGDKRPYRKYSLGMRQKLAIAQAIMEKPDVLMFDEPTNALDEEGIKRFYSIIKEEKERGALILIASHNQSDIEEPADLHYEMRDGRLVDYEK